MSRLPHFLDNRLTDGGEAVSLTCQAPFSPGKIPGTHICLNKTLKPIISSHLCRLQLHLPFTGLHSNSFQSHYLLSLHTALSIAHYFGVYLRLPLVTLPHLSTSVKYDPCSYIRSLDSSTGSFIQTKFSMHILFCLLPGCLDYSLTPKMVYAPPKFDELLPDYMVSYSRRYHS
jgi:hypothetical protein